MTKKELLAKGRCHSAARAILRPGASGSDPHEEAQAESQHCPARLVYISYYGKGMALRDGGRPQ